MASQPPIRIFGDHHPDFNNSVDQILKEAGITHYKIENFEDIQSPATQITGNVLIFRHHLRTRAPDFDPNRYRLPNAHNTTLVVLTRKDCVGDNAEVQDLSDHVVKASDLGVSTVVGIPLYYGNYDHGPQGTMVPGNAKNIAIKRIQEAARTLTHSATTSSSSTMPLVNTSSPSTSSTSNSSTSTTSIAPQFNTTTRASEERKLSAALPSESRTGTVRVFSANPSSEYDFLIHDILSRLQPRITNYVIEKFDNVPPDQITGNALIFRRHTGVRAPSIAGYKLPNADRATLIVFAKEDCVNNEAQLYDVDTGFITNPGELGLNSVIGIGLYGNYDRGPGGTIIAGKATEKAIERIQQSLSAPSKPKMSK